MRKTKYVETTKRGKLSVGPESEIGKPNLTEHISMDNSIGAAA
jgi:hypothetical protein